MRDDRYHHPGARMQIPSVPVPYTGRIDPRARSICAQSNGWVQRMGMMSPDMAAEHFDRLAYAHLGTRYSYGATREGAQILADLTCWFFLWDDQHDRLIIEGKEHEWRRQVTQIREVVHDPVGSNVDHPAPRALGDILRRIRPHFSGVWWRRFTQHWDGVVEANDREFDNRSAGASETIDNYIELRRRSVAMIMWMDLVELAAQTELPPQVYYSPEYQTCVTATVDYCAWCNDLHSLAKERSAADTSNIVTVISQARGCGLETAVEETLQRMAARIEDFLRAEQMLTIRIANGMHLDEAVRQGLHRCLLSMRDWNANMDAWHRISARYLDAAPGVRLQYYNEDLARLEQA